LAVEAVVLGLKAASERAEREADRQACLNAITLIRTLDANRVGVLTAQIEALGRAIQQAHAAWVSVGAPGKWEDEQKHSPLDPQQSRA
jgi:hypothetical protein